MYKIRPALVEDAAGIAKVHIDTWRTTYVGFVPDDYLASLSYDQRAARHAETLSGEATRRGWFVAEDAQGKIVGFVCGAQTRDTADGYDSELYALYVYKDLQGKGIGKALVDTLKSFLVQEGYRAMKLWVIEGNPSCAFYEHVGGKLIPGQKKIVTIGGRDIVELAYGYQLP